MADREPRMFRVVSCYDCGYVGNRVEEAKEWGYDGTVTINTCPDCGEAVGAWLTVREVMADAVAQAGRDVRA